MTFENNERGEQAVAQPPDGHGQLDWLAALRIYFSVIAIGNLVWETAHLPLYTLWNTGSTGEKIFAVVHCTGGDLLIAVAAIALALIMCGNRHWPTRRFWPVAAVTLVLGIAYTFFSEWLNIVVRKSWAYSDLMPVIDVFGFHVGLSPLLQWIVIPALAFWRCRPMASPQRR